MIITISGMPGSGKTTLAKRLKDALGFEHYYMGGIRRKIAKDNGMTIEEFNKLGETDPSTDKVVDDYLIELGKTKDNFIAEGRTAKHFIPNSIGIFMDVNLTVAAERISKDLQDKNKSAERNEESGESITEKAELLKKRVESDTLRYQKYYGIDVCDKSMYDLLIDTSDMTVDEVFERILKFLEKAPNVTT